MVLWWHRNTIIPDYEISSWCSTVSCWYQCRVECMTLESCPQRHAAGTRTLDLIIHCWQDVNEIARNFHNDRAFSLLNAPTTRVPCCCWSPDSGAQIPASCVLACYWSITVCYWGTSQSQTTTQLAGIWAPLHGDQQHTGTLVISEVLYRQASQFQARPIPLV